MGIAEGILASAIAAASDAGATRIDRVDVTVGALTEVMDDALRFAWDALTPGTMAEGSTLSITTPGARSRCVECGVEFDHGRFDGGVCASCGSFLVELLAGRELTISGIDID